MKATKTEKKQINYWKGIAIVSLTIIALAVTFGSGMYAGHSMAQPVQVSK